MYIKPFQTFVNESIFGSLFGKKPKPEVKPEVQWTWDFTNSQLGKDVKLDYLKAGSLHILSGNIGKIESSIRSTESNFTIISNELSKKIEPIKKLIKDASATNISGHYEKPNFIHKGPVIVSFPETKNQRSAYVMNARFSKFPNENRVYDRTEYYIGEDDIVTWLNYFVNEYKTEPVIEKNFKASPLTLKGHNFNKVNIFSLVKELATNNTVQLSKRDCIDLISSLPPVYHQFISFAIDATVEICNKLDICFLIGESGINLEKSNIDLNNKDLIKELNESFNKNKCKTIKELANLHLELANKYSK